MTYSKWLIQKQQSWLTRVPIDKILWPCFNKNVCHKEASASSLGRVCILPVCSASPPFAFPRHSINSHFELTAETSFFSLSKLIPCESDMPGIKVVYTHKTFEKEWQSSGSLWPMFNFTTAQHTTSCYFLTTKSVCKLCNPTGVNAIVWQQTHTKWKN